MAKRLDYRCPVSRSFTYFHLARDSCWQSGEVVAWTRRQCKLEAARTEGANLLRDKAKAIGSVIGSVDGALDCNGSDFGNDLISTQDQQIVVRPKHPVSTGTNAGGEVACSPITADPYQTDRSVPIDRGSASIIASEDLGMIGAIDGSQTGDIKQTKWAVKGMQFGFSSPVSPSWT